MLSPAAAAPPADSGAAGAVNARQLTCAPALMTAVGPSPSILLQVFP